jgi:hypothetical protein
VEEESDEVGLVERKRMKMKEQTKRKHALNMFPANKPTVIES